MSKFDFTDRTAAWKSISGKKMVRPLALDDGNFRLFHDDNLTEIEYHDYNSDGKVLKEMRVAGLEREPISGHLDNIIGGWTEPFSRAIKTLTEAVEEEVAKPNVFEGQEIIEEKYDWKEVRLDQPATTEGRKDDQAKLPFHLLAPEFLEDVAAVLAFGVKKYNERNWEKGMDWNRPFAALMRHMWAWWKGERNDEETGLSHLAHAACCIMFLLAYERRNIGKDNRPNA